MLEILSVCCYYSDSTASLVVGGMRLLARSQNEAPFACLSRALVQQDIEVKAAVMQVCTVAQWRWLSLTSGVPREDIVDSTLFSLPFSLSLFIDSS